MVSSGSEHADRSDDQPGTGGSDSSDAAPSATAVAGKPWFRQPRTLAVIGVIAAVVIAGLVFVIGRDSSSRPGSAGSGMTIPQYFAANNITATPVYRGEPGTPVISFTVPRGWTDAGPEAPDGAYGAAFYDSSVDVDYPSSIVVLLSKLSGNADPAKILEAAPGELEALPDYTVVSKPQASTMSGFDAIQLSGLYTREDGEQRIIAQKTVVIPAQDGMYVLQMNADGPRDEARVIQEATVVLDERAEIAP